MMLFQSLLWMEKTDLISVWVGVEVILVPAEFLQNNRKHWKTTEKTSLLSRIETPQVLESLSSPFMPFHSIRIKGTWEEQSNAHDARLHFTSYRFGLDQVFTWLEGFKEHTREFSATPASAFTRCTITIARCQKVLSEVVLEWGKGKLPLDELRKPNQCQNAQPGQGSSVLLWWDRKGRLTALYINAVTAIFGLKTQHYLCLCLHNQEPFWEDSLVRQCFPVWILNLEVIRSEPEPLLHPWANVLKS